MDTGLMGKIHQEREASTSTSSIHGDHKGEVVVAAVPRFVQMETQSGKDVVHSMVGEAVDANSFLRSHDAGDFEYQCWLGRHRIQAHLVDGISRISPPSRNKSKHISTLAG